MSDAKRILAAFARLPDTVTPSYDANQLVGHYLIAKEARKRGTPSIGKLMVAMSTPEEFVAAFIVDDGWQQSFEQTMSPERYEALYTMAKMEVKDE